MPSARHRRWSQNSRNCSSGHSNRGHLSGRLVQPRGRWLTAQDSRRDDTHREEKRKDSSDENALKETYEFLEASLTQATESSGLPQTERVARLFRKTRPVGRCDGASRSHAFRFVFHQTHRDAPAVDFARELRARVGARRHRLGLQWRTLIFGPELESSARRTRRRENSETHSRLFWDRICHSVQSQERSRLAEGRRRPRREPASIADFSCHGGGTSRSASPYP